MKFKITTTVKIDIDEIIYPYNLNSNSTNEEVKDAVYDFLLDLPAPDIYLIGEDEAKQIMDEINARLTKK